VQAQQRAVQAQQRAVQAQQRAVQAQQRAVQARLRRWRCGTKGTCPSAAARGASRRGPPWPSPAAPSVLLVGQGHAARSPGLLLPSPATPTRCPATPRAPPAPRPTQPRLGAGLLAPHRDAAARLAGGTTGRGRL
jgi:hypothetical protein